MFGRESSYEDLLSTIDKLISTPQEDFEFEQSILEEFKLTEETIDMDIEDVFLPSSEQCLDEMSLLDQERGHIFKSAAKSIRSDQLRQKRQFDKKVNENRCVVFNIEILYY